MEKGLFQDRYRIDSCRLSSWNYEWDGWYFVTICSKDREHFFGYIYNEKMYLNEIGQVAKKCWLEIPKHFPDVILDEFIIMPNHVHGIITIDKNMGDEIIHDDVGVYANVIPKGANVETQNFASLQTTHNTFGPQSRNLASIIRGFKIGVTKYVIEHGIEFKWQPRFHDHIIRNDSELQKIREYIIDNPIKWNRDRNNL